MKGRRPKLPAGKRSAIRRCTGKLNEFQKKNIIGRRKSILDYLELHREYLKRLFVVFFNTEFEI
jgi:ssDNA-specific exonuclease RecJ